MAKNLVTRILEGHMVEGSLDPGEDAEARRHLRGCGACRRELGALRDGLGVLGSSLERPPPAGLRDRVLGALQEEWAEERPGPAGVPRWGAFATAAAVAVALVAGTVAVLQMGRARDAAGDAQSYRTVLATLGGTGFRVGELQQAGRTPVTGSVVAYESSHDQSFVVVFVRVPELRGEGSLLVSRSDGTTWDPGSIGFDGDGDAAVWWVTDRSIATMSGLRVRAPDGTLLATAALRDA